MKTSRFLLVISLLSLIGLPAVSDYTAAQSCPQSSIAALNSSDFGSSSRYYPPMRGLPGRREGAGTR